LSKLLLVRHGETALNSSQRYWGRTDVELGNRGLQQAESLRDRLLSEKIDRAYSSQLKRSIMTAETVVSKHNLKVISSAYLNEIDFGDLEGLDYSQISQKYPEVVNGWTQRNPELKYPSGESLLQMEVRVREFRNVLEGPLENETILIVAHSGILRTLICQLLGLDMNYRWSLRIDLASLSIVETYPGTAILSLLNDVSHLEKDK
jgi:alpha-ribazole phosphatase